MNKIDYKEKLIEFYYQSSNLTEFGLETEELRFIDEIILRIAKNKGVYTVLITLALYKVFNPEQDIRQQHIFSSLIFI